MSPRARVFEYLIPQLVTAMAAEGSSQGADI